MIRPRRHNYNNFKGNARHLRNALHLRNAGKPKETQKKYQEAEAWAKDAGPDIVELARELLRNWDSLEAFRKARKDRQPDNDWGPLTVEVEDESAEEFKLMHILNPELTHDHVQHRLAYLRQLDMKPRTWGPWIKLDYARQKALHSLDQNLWIITYLEALDHKKYTPLYVVQKGNYFEYRGEWELSFYDNEACVWQQHQPSAQHHNFAANKGYVSYKTDKKLSRIADKENTLVNMAGNPIGIRHNFLGDKKNPVTEAEVKAVVRELLIDGKKVVASRHNEAYYLIEKLMEERHD